MSCIYVENVSLPPLSVLLFSAEKRDKSEFLSATYFVDRLINLCEHVKNTLSSNNHIHLYTKHVYNFSLLYLFHSEKLAYSVMYVCVRAGTVVSV
jgi:hypothetical protein